MSEECPVCLEPPKAGDTVRTDCGHEYCQACVDKWFDQGESSCPLCRTPIKYIERRGERIRVLIKTHVEPGPAVPTGPMINLTRYYYLGRWVLFQWFLIMILAIVLFSVLSDNTELVKTNEEIIDDSYSDREKLSTCLEKISDVRSISIRTGSNLPGRYYHYLQCGIPSYYLDLCL